MTGALSPSLAASQTQVLPPALQGGSQLGAFQGIQGLTGQPLTGVRPGQANLLTNQQVFNPFAPQAQQGAGMAASFGQAAAGNQFNLGGNLEQLGGRVSAEGQPLIKDANTVMQMGLDPQQQLYQRYLQLMQQQTAATNAQSGVGATPYAAGLDAQSNALFQIQWNAQQQTNAVNALNAASGAYGQAGQLQQAGAGISQMGAGLQAGAAPLFMQSAMYPYQTSELMSQTGMQALQQLLGYGQAGTQMTSQQITDYLSLLGLVPNEQNAISNAASVQNTIQQTGFNELAALGSAAGKAAGFAASGGLSNLGGAFGGVPGSSMFTPTGR